MIEISGHVIIEYLILLLIIGLCMFSIGKSEGRMEMYRLVRKVVEDEESYLLSLEFKYEEGECSFGYYKGNLCMSIFWWKRFNHYMSEEDNNKVSIFASKLVKYGRKKWNTLVGGL